MKPPALKLPAGRAPAEEEVMRKAKRNAKRKPFLLPSFVLLFGRRKTTPKENVEVAPSVGIWLELFAKAGFGAILG